MAGLFHEVIFPQNNCSAEHDLAVAQRTNRAQIAVDKTANTCLALTFGTPFSGSFDTKRVQVRAGTSGQQWQTDTDETVKSKVGERNSRTKWRTGHLNASTGGEGGIRTPDTAFDRITV